MVLTKKFSEFTSGGTMEAGDQTAGLDAGANAIFDVALQFLPSGTTAQRPATPVASMIRYNTDTNLFEFYDGSMWLPLQSGGDVAMLIARLAAHTAGDGASMIGLENQSGVTNKTVQDLANAALIAKTDNGTLTNGQFLDALASGMVSVDTVTGTLSSRILTGTANKIDIANGDGSGTPTFTISPTYVGQTSITTLGTIGTGTWQATAIGAIYGGTGQTTYALGDILYASAANVLSKLAGNTTAAIQYLAQTGTGIISAAPAWTTISGGDITGAALTVGNDANVTLTLGGTPATALLRAASVTAGWSGTLAPSRGGLGTSSVPIAGQIPIGNSGGTYTIAAISSGTNILVGNGDGSISISITGIISPTNGGTGVNNGSSTLTLGGNLTTSGAFASTFTMTGATNVTFPTSGTLATTAGTVSSITGTANQITASSPTGAVTLAIASNPVLPGTGGVTLPQGNTAAQAGAAGTIRFNTQTTVFEGTLDGATWTAFSTAAGTVTSVSGTANRITSTGGTTPVIDISASYVGQTSITTLGTIGTGTWQGTVVALAFGGTNKNITASAGAIVYSDADSFELSAVGSSGQLFQSAGTSAPGWTTATYPSVATTTGTILRADGANWAKSTATFADTYTASNLLYSNGANTVTGLATANSAVLVTNSTGVPAWSGTMTNGQLIIGSTGATPTAATLTQGSGVTITNGAGTITISASGSAGLTWTTVSGTSQAAAVNNGYVTNNAGAVTVTLPTTFAVGDVVEIKGLGAGGWVLAAGTATTIRLGSSVTSSAGSLTSANRYDSIKVVGLEANTTWSADYAFSAGLTVA